MELVLLFDHRFYRDAEGRLFSLKNYAYEIFAKRYLAIFDAVRVVARVAGAPSDEPCIRPTEGPGVEVRSLGDWSGPAGLLAHGRRVRERLRAEIPPRAAVIMIVPGQVGGLARRDFGQGRPYGVEVVGDPHDGMAPGAMQHPLRPLLRALSTRELRRQCADAVAAAYVTREALQYRYPCPGYSVGVSDVELGDDAFAANPRPPVSRAKRTTVITVGTLAQLYKAPEVLIDAIAVCVREQLDVALVMVGDGRFRAELSARAARLGIADRVTFLGNLPAGPAVRDALDGAELFVLASRQEGLPRAMVEAMARGLPCIGSTVGGIPELLPHDDLVPPGDVGALARRIREVVTSPVAMAHMSARNLERAREYREDLLRARRAAFYEYVRTATEDWLAGIAHHAV